MKISKFIEKSPLVPTLLAAEAISQSLEHELRLFDLSIIEALILVGVLFEEKDARPSELARAFRVSRSRLSQALSKLLKSGYLTRKIESKDARFINIQITNSGRQTALKLIKVFDKESGIVEKRLGVKKAEKLAESLLRYLDV